MVDKNTRTNGLSRRVLLSAAGAALAVPSRLTARPELTLEGPVFADLGTLSHLRELHLSDPAGGVDHVIWAVWPRRTPPPGGWPSVWALDGKAVGALLKPADFERLAEAGLALVALGRDRPERFATAERARDYTPPDPQGLAMSDPRGRDGGGAPDFLALIRDRVMPGLGDLPLDPGARRLWGHSYGGLFALYTAFTGQSPFAGHVAASPALWWDEARFWQSLLDAAPPATRIDTAVGSAERARASRPEGAGGLISMRERLPEDALAQLRAHLRGAGVPGEDVTFPGLSHGEAFAASLCRTLGLPERA